MFGGDDVINGRLGTPAGLRLVEQNSAHARTGEGRLARKSRKMFPVSAFLFTENICLDSTSVKISDLIITRHCVIK